uniref:Uncharacterized protein n=1 Tax=Cacopsylla melanoneura TaxID=428564 RepID=A0A8D9BNZ6_9HEMI
MSLSSLSQGNFLPMSKQGIHYLGICCIYFFSFLFLLFFCHIFSFSLFPTLGKASCLSILHIFPTSPCSLSLFLSLHSSHIFSSLSLPHTFLSSPIYFFPFLFNLVSNIGVIASSNTLRCWEASFNGT